MKTQINPTKLPDRGLKKWGKHIQTVNPDERTGYGFEGDWLPSSNNTSVPVGDYFIWYFESGDKDDPTPNVVLYQAKATGAEEIQRWEGLPQRWADQIIDRVAELVNDGDDEADSAVAKLRKRLSRETSRDIGGSLVSCFQRLVTARSPGIVGAREMMMAVLDVSVTPFSEMTRGEYERLIRQAEIEIVEDEKEEE